ncbi:hypothetical protein CWC26_15105 [Pseudoalteromonas sp. S4488]|uniref:hypothetical protein n=1 Tax=unclassified Pseudoalteromonas TaxID=194690 RepID=UPI001022D112|nr:MULTISPECIES: hypothetical protein [unclassified Pseudoalteromonas]RZF87252.1 hypothetical protein EXT43_04205 [Pseudoalteromonas sp. CO109Y]TMO36734.1 hypothetical protein CWC26_15105 [Pseudoalteromonas sp. S4488]TMO38097.1 hypothetical protein CWC27_03785 [Pseudoalteromonas sp. S4491]
MYWGLLGPDKITSQRRTRTLGLSSIVRKFNDLAVPGLGGVKYAKSVFLACLGVDVAEKVRQSGKQVTNIQVTNAIEALACYLAYGSTEWNKDDRLRGRTKLNSPADLSYKTFSGTNFYVTQPMRMSTVQALPGLGFVESKGERFNSFSLNQLGKDFVDAACASYRCHRLSIIDFLARWVKDEKQLPSSYTPSFGELLHVMSPLVRLDQHALNLFKQALLSGENNSRRRGVLKWTQSENLKTYVNWTKPFFIEQTHFDDLKSGAFFFELRNKSLDLLNVIEAEIAPLNPPRLELSEPLSQSIIDAVSNLKKAANAFLSLEHDPSTSKEATYFANQCLQKNDTDIIISLLERDEVVLRCRGKQVLPAAAFGKPEPVNNEEHDYSLFPKGISFRVWNMYVLNQDFENKLEEWLGLEGDNDE